MVQDYQFAFQLKNCRVPLGTRVSLHDLREAHGYGMSLIRRMLERVGLSSPGWVLRICDGLDQPLLHVIVPAHPANCGLAGASSRGERDEAWSAAITRLEALARDRPAGHGPAWHRRHVLVQDECAREDLAGDGLAGSVLAREGLAREGDAREGVAWDGLCRDGLASEVLAGEVLAGDELVQGRLAPHEPVRDASAGADRAG